MKQVTLRLDDELAGQLAAAAAARDMSVNAYAAWVLGAAVDPDLAGAEVDRLRERLARAGVLEAPRPGGRRRPPRAAVERARAAAGGGRPLSVLVREGRR